MKDKTIALLIILQACSVSYFLTRPEILETECPTCEKIEYLEAELTEPVECPATYIEPECPQCEDCTQTFGYRRYNEKFKWLDLMMMANTMPEYTEDYKCVPFAKSLQSSLRDAGIESIILSVKKPDGGLHAINCIPVEAQTGEFVKPDKYIIRKIYTK